MAPDRGGVSVCVRFRPQNDLERAHNGKACVEYPSDESCLVGGANQFTFDRVFAPATLQVDVYAFAAQAIVEAVLDGYNGTVLAYGQTSSGKTYTMEGASSDEQENHGIIPRMVDTLLDGITRAPAHTEFTIAMSMLEIYMERIRDLLADADAVKAHPTLTVHEDRSGTIFVQGLSQEWVASKEEILGLLARGAQRRTTGETRMNAGSSRSHSVVMVHVRQRDVRTGCVKTGRLCLVDLAGSEKVAKTWASGTALEEAKTINKSLSALGNVINALTADKGGAEDRDSGCNTAFIPYRDSKLTRVLQESLGGNARTALIVTCSESSYNIEETLSSLRFGQRAKRMRNKPVVNRELSATEYARMLREEQSAARALADELGMLKELLSAVNRPSMAPAGAPDADATSQVSSADSLRALVDRLESERDGRVRAELDASRLADALEVQTRRADDLEAEHSAVTEASALMEAENDELYDRLAKTTVALDRANAQRDMLSAEVSKLREAAEVRKGQEAVEVSKLREAAEVSKGQEAVEVSKLREAAEVSKGQEAVEVSKPREAAARADAHEPTASTTPPSDPQLRNGASTRASVADEPVGDGSSVAGLNERLRVAEQDNLELCKGLQAKISRVIELEIALDAQREAQRRTLDALGAWGLYDELDNLRSRHGQLEAEHEALAAEHAHAIVALRVAEEKLSTRTRMSSSLVSSPTRTQATAQRLHKPRPALRGGGAKAVAGEELD